MVDLVCANDKIGRYCTVFVGRFLREDARKSATGFFLLANEHCAVGKKNGRDNDEGRLIVKAVEAQQ